MYPARLRAGRLVRTELLTLASAITDDPGVIRSLRMPTDQIVTLLIAERDKLTRAIEVLQGARRRGRAAEESIRGVGSLIGSHTERTQAWNCSAAARQAQSRRINRSLPLLLIGTVNPY